MSGGIKEGTQIKQWRRPPACCFRRLAGNCYAMDGRIAFLWSTEFRRAQKNPAGHRIQPARRGCYREITGYDVAKSTFGTSRTDGGTLKKSPSDLKLNIFATRMLGKVSHLLR